jgi:hypothetical protein
MEACFSTEICLERSLSNPCDVLDKFDKNVLKLKAVSDGEGEEKLFLVELKRSEKQLTVRLG